MRKIEIKNSKERQPDRREEGEKGEGMQIRQTRLLLLIGVLSPGNHYGLY